MTISMDIVNRVDTLQTWELILKALNSGLLALELDLATAYKERNQDQLQHLNRLLTAGMNLTGQIEDVLEQNVHVKVEIIKDYPWEPGDLEFVAYSLEKLQGEVNVLVKQFSENGMHQSYVEKLELLGEKANEVRRTIG